jgi:DNA mismatch repair protein MSH4
MSGKSTYIRSIALMTVMAQIGCYVSAAYASFPLIHQLFARVCMDDSIEANVSTFAAEMRETAFILRHASHHVIVARLCLLTLAPGTSTRIAWPLLTNLVEERAHAMALQSP